MTIMGLCDISFRYRDAASDVRADLKVQSGECVVLAGPSGSGKTTLTRLVNGLAPTYYPGTLQGRIIIRETDAALQPFWQRSLVVGSVFQDPASQFFSSDLAGEVAFACENLGYSQARIKDHTDKAIERFDLDALRDRPLDVLSSGEKQRVAIASVCALRPPILVCDEPTANLDEEASTYLARTFKLLKEQGCTLLIAEHRLAWLEGLADRFIFLREGVIEWERTPEKMAELTTHERTVAGLRSSIPIPLPDLAAPHGEGIPSLATYGISCKRHAKMIWSHVSFSAYPGQIIALTGRNGSGKTTLAKVLSGLLRHHDGEIRLHGKPASPGRQRAAVWYGSNDTGTQFFTNSVTEELLIGSDRSDATLDRARAIVHDFGLYPFKDAHPASLSGGQKQRLSLACGLLSGRDILIFDEPTSGLDGANMVLVAQALKRAADGGVTVIVITHDGELAQRCCTHRVDMGALCTKD